jgi:hypothetical protein
VRAKTDAFGVVGAYRKGRGNSLGSHLEQRGDLDAIEEWGWADRRDYWCRALDDVVVKLGDVRGARRYAKPEEAAFVIASHHWLSAFT